MGAYVVTEVDVSSGAVTIEWDDDARPEDKIPDRGVIVRHEDGCFRVGMTGVGHITDAGSFVMDELDIPDDEG